MKTNDQKQQPSLVKNVQLMKEKIAILAIMELAFQKPSENRVLSFSEISAAVNQPIDSVLFFLSPLLFRFINLFIEQKG